MKDIKDNQLGTKEKKTSEETKLKLSESHKGKKLSPESIIKRTETRKRNKILKEIEYANTLVD